MRITESEEALQFASKHFLDFALPDGTVYWHTPNGGHRKKAVAGKLKAQGVLAGVPDWTIIHNGKVIFLELKTRRGTLTDGQKEFRDRVQAQGLDHYVCRSLTEIELALNAAGVPVKARAA